MTTTTVPDVDTGYSLQWYGPPLAIGIGELDVPEAMLPVSSEWSLNPIRCVTLSRFRQTTICPAAIFAGLGLNDPLPSTPTTSMTTTDPEVDDGPAGFAALELADGPQPQRQRANAAALTAAEHIRTVVVLSLCRRDRAAIGDRCRSPITSIDRQRRRTIYSAVV